MQIAVIESISTFLQNLIQYIEPPFSVKIFSAVFSAFLFVLIVVLTIKSDRLWKLKMMRESANVVNFPKEFDKKWQLILNRMQRRDEANLKLAVIEADKLFDTILMHMGYKGKDMGERLEQMTAAQLSCIDDVWLAHKVRNRIVHEPEHHITMSEAESAIAAYEKAFKELQIL